jgi:hypothetical protein
VSERGVFIDDVRPEDIARELKVDVEVSWSPLLIDADHESLEIEETALVEVAS